MGGGGGIYYIAIRSWAKQRYDLFSCQNNYSESFTCNSFGRSEHLRNHNFKMEEIVSFIGATVIHAWLVWHNLCHGYYRHPWNKSRSKNTVLDFFFFFYYWSTFERNCVFNNPYSHKASKQHSVRKTIHACAWIASPPRMETVSCCSQKLWDPWWKKIVVI